MPGHVVVDDEVDGHSDVESSGDCRGDHHHADPPRGEHSHRLLLLSDGLASMDNDRGWHTVQPKHEVGGGLQLKMGVNGRIMKIVKTSLPYFGVKLSCVCLKFDL